MRISIRKLKQIIREAVADTNDQDFLEDVLMNTTVEPGEDDDLNEGFGSGVEVGIGISLGELIAGLSLLGSGIAVFAAKNLISKFREKQSAKRAAIELSKRNERFNQVVEKLKNDPEIADLIEELESAPSSSVAKQISKNLTTAIESKTTSFTSRDLRRGLNIRATR